MRPLKGCGDGLMGLENNKMIVENISLCLFFPHVPLYSGILFHTFFVPSLDKSCDWLQGVP